MDELIVAVEQVVAALDDFLARQRESGEPAPEAREALNRLAVRAADAAASTRGQQVWDEHILSDQSAFEAAPVPLLVTDAMGFVVRANGRLRELVATTSELLAGQHVGEFIHSADYDNMADVWVRMQVDVNFDSTIIEFRLLTPRGARWHRAAIRASRNDDMTLANLVVHFADTDSKHAAEEALDRSARTFGNLLDSLPDPITRVNRAFEVQFANPAAEKFRHLNPTYEWPHVLEDERERYLRAAEHCWKTGESTTVEHWMLAGDDLLWCDTTFVAEFGPSTKVETMLILWRDQTNRRKHEELLAHRAMHDPLTGLPNRSRFADLLEQAIARQSTAAEVGQSRPLAVLFLDLDRFKFVNDSLGHLAGDELLQGVGRRLSTTVRPGDVIGRLGGDEFTILAEDISPEDAELMAERVQERFKEPFDLNGREFIVSASIGVVSSDSPQDATDLMRWADSAMYRAKSLGRSRVATFEQVFAPDVLDQLDMDQLIRTAVQRDELEVHYQPEVECPSRRIVGVEALLRWNHPAKGLLSADRFIPVAEDNGTIIPIGNWVLRRACEQVHVWDSMGFIDEDFVLRVNLSPLQLEQERLPQTVTEVLEETSVDPRRLCLEITETGLMRDPEHALVVLDELASLGVKLAVDDFGTGYSSLSSLKRFPIDVLKIDRSFVSGISKGSRDAAIVRTVVNLADTLGLLPTAEGVETDEQCALLEEIGCFRAQGYLFSRPVPAAEFGEMLRRGLDLRHQPANG